MEHLADRQIGPGMVAPEARCDSARVWVDDLAGRRDVAEAQCTLVLLDADNRKIPG